MIYVWKTIAALAGAAVIAAATHANVELVGGYHTTDAWLLIAIAALLALGMAYCVIAWREGHRAGAIVLGLCLLSGEVYWLATNAEREIAKREDLAAPLREAEAQRARAEARVSEAKAALLAAGSAGQYRLTAALDAQKAADDAAVSEASKRGCLKNCAALLMDAKDRAATEVREAREAIDAAKARAEMDVAKAEAALAALPPARSAAPLAERLGMEPWAWDLIMALLRSVAVIGGAIAVALALHPKTTSSAAPATTDATRTPATANFRLVAEGPRLLTARAPQQEHVAEFLKAVLRPDPEGSASLRRLYGRYSDWCEARTVEPLPPAELGQHLRTIIDAIGLEIEPDEQDMIVRGAALAA